MSATLNDDCLEMRRSGAPNWKRSRAYALRRVQARGEDADRLRRDAEPPDAETRERDLVAVAFVAEQRVRRHLRVLRTRGRSCPTSGSRACP